MSRDTGSVPDPKVVIICNYLCNACNRVWSRIAQNVSDVAILWRKLSWYLKILCCGMPQNLG